MYFPVDGTAEVWLSDLDSGSGEAGPVVVNGHFVVEFAVATLTVVERPPQSSRKRFLGVGSARRRLIVWCARSLVEQACGIRHVAVMVR